jgi:colanic acid/amylovoran biosynthesis glycosyltransferase
LNRHKSNICVVLPYPADYSETFLRAHVEGLSGVVNYLNGFPVDTRDAYGIHKEYEKTQRLEQRLKGFLHRYVVNPGKTIYLRHFFKANAVSVVLAEYGVTGIGVMEICHQLEIPLVVHFHGYDAYSREILDRYASAYKIMFGYCSGIIAVSRSMVEQLIRLGAPREKVFYNACGVDITEFKKTCLPRSAVQVLATGRFVEKKAPYLTLLAFKKVLDVVPEAHLVMVGGGVLLDVCRKIARSLHIEHAVEFSGPISHKEVANLMQQSRIFVQHSLVPSSGDSEGTPVGIIEAGASGLPVVSTKHGGIVDAVIDGKTGFLVDEGDIDGMAENMCRLLSNKELAVEMGRRAREHIAMNFELETSIKKLRAILEQCSLSAVGNKRCAGRLVSDKVGS